jgi:hypothetical protein
MNKTIFIAAMLAVATALAAGLTVLPASVQEAQANPCSNNLDADETSQNNRIGNIGDQECDLTGYFEFDEEGTSDNNLAAPETDGAEATETDGAEATTGNNIVDDPLLDLSQIDNIDEAN